MRIRLAVLASLACCLLGAVPAHAETDWFASLYTNEGVELRADERVFALYAVLNAMGYDEAPVVRALPVPARDMHSVRLKVRSALRLDAADVEKLNGFFNGHAKAAEAYGRYVLSLKGPGSFERTPAAAADLKGFESLLADDYSRLKLGELFASVQDEYRTSLKGYHAVVDAPVTAVRRLLKLKEDDPPRVILVVNLLDGQGKAYSTRTGEEELWVVVGPSKAPDLYAVAQEVARSRLEPLVAAKVSEPELAAQASDRLSRAFAALALALPEAELDARGQRDGFPTLKDWVKQVDAFAKGATTLEAFVAEAAPALLKEQGKEPAAATPATPAKKPGKK
ncbi:MAG: hypothetical protein QM765_01285 [Myxococcales bacterium]